MTYKDGSKEKHRANGCMPNHHIEFDSPVKTKESICTKTTQWLYSHQHINSKLKQP